MLSIIVAELCGEELLLMSDLCNWLRGKPTWYVKGSGLRMLPPIFFLGLADVGEVSEFDVVKVFLGLYYCLEIASLIAGMVLMWRLRQGGKWREPARVWNEHCIDLESSVIKEEMGCNLTALCADRGNVSVIDPRMYIMGELWHWHSKESEEETASRLSQYGVGKIFTKLADMTYQ